jgi:hypothetical protein
MMHLEHTFPQAPRTPIVACLVTAESSLPMNQEEHMTGSYDGPFRTDECICLLPYMDLPHYALEEQKAIAFINKRGQSGWISKSVVDEWFTTQFEVDDLVEYAELFSTAGWDMIGLPYENIDWKKHFHLRNDDQMFDPVPGRIFDATDACLNCGHIGFDRISPCEACKDTKGRQIIQIDIEELDDGLSDFQREWS